MTTFDQDEAALRRLVDALFIHTDRKAWPEATALFAEGPVEVDMTSLVGGEPFRLTGAELIGAFAQGLHAGKASHHMAANYRITVDGNRATVWAHGYAYNQVPALPEGRNVWETWGNYLFDAVRTPAGWRLSAFRYFSKRTAGDDAVRTHQP